jgi:transposase, IS5 family
VPAWVVKHSAGGQFVTHVAALPGNPYDGHTLATVIPKMQALIGNVLDRCITDAGYRGRNAPPDSKFKAPRHPQIKRKFKRSAAIEPVIGHLKDTAWVAIPSPMQAAMPSTPCLLPLANFRRLLAWLRFLLFGILITLGL